MSNRALAIGVQVFAVLPRFAVVFLLPVLVDPTLAEHLLLALIVIDVGSVTIDVGRNQGILASRSGGRASNILQSFIGFGAASLVVSYLSDVSLLVAMTCCALFHRIIREAHKALAQSDYFRHIFLVAIAYPVTLGAWLWLPGQSFILVGFLFVMLTANDLFRNLEVNRFGAVNAYLLGGSAALAGLAQRLDAFIANEFLEPRVFVDVVQLNASLALLTLAARVTTNTSLLTGTRVFDIRGRRMLALTPLVGFGLWCVYMAIAYVFENQIMWQFKAELALLIIFSLAMLPFRETLSIQIRKGNVAPSFFFSSLTLGSLICVWLLFSNGLLSGVNPVLELYLIPRVVMIVGAIMIALFLVKRRIHG